MPLWRALRVIGGRAGVLRVGGARAAVRRPRPRARACSRSSSTRRPTSGRAQLVSVVGIAGIGKSRLAWEFEKYLDGLAGDGLVASRPLPLLRRRRRRTGRSRRWCGCARDRRGRGARRRRWRSCARRSPSTSPTPRSAPGSSRGSPTCSRSEEASLGDQENLFSAWRLLFERLAERDPVVLVFEDMQWADAGLLDFVEYLLDWSREPPHLRARAGAARARRQAPAWGAGKRSFDHALARAALRRRRWASCSSGFVPGLPDELRRRRSSTARRACRCTRSRRCACCSTAACSRRRATATARPGRSTRSRCPRRCMRCRRPPRRPRAGGAPPRPGRLGARQVVHASRPGRARGLGAGRARAAARLARCARRCCRSRPTRARPSAASTLPPGPGPARRLRDALARRARRRSTWRRPSSFLDASAEEDEIVEVVAAHYLDAYRAAPDAADAEEIRVDAARLLVRAGRRAASLGATSRRSARSSGAPS